jgi:hypothetical protein
MQTFSRLGLAAVALVVFGLMAMAQLRAKTIAFPAAQTPSARVAAADSVVIGKVTEVEADTVEVTAYPGAPADQKTTYKVATIKIDEALMGASGLTQFRVGFPADAPVAGEPGAPVRPGGPIAPGGGGRIRRPQMAVALSAGMEGCFFLTRHHDGDFYVLAGGPPLLAKAETYAKELEQVKKVVKAIDDPVAALKAKDLDDRFRAAQAILQRYQTVRNQRPGHPPVREPIPDAETKLIVALLKELPWIPTDPAPGGPGAEVKPNRSALWYQINPAESGFKDPTFPVEKPGDPPVDFNKIMEDASSKFLTDNADKIKIKRFVQK